MPGEPAAARLSPRDAATQGAKVGRSARGAQQNRREGGGLLGGIGRSGSVAGAAVSLLLFK